MAENAGPDSPDVEIAKGPKATAILRPKEMNEYRHALRMRGEQQNRVAAARAELKKEEFFQEASHDRCAVLWSDICAWHDLDTEATYKVEDSGLVYVTTQQE